MDDPPLYSLIDEIPNTTATPWTSSLSSLSLSYDNPFIPGERVKPSGRPGGYAEVHNHQWLTKAFSETMVVLGPQQAMPQQSGQYGGIMNIAPPLRFNGVTPTPEIGQMQMHNQGPSTGGMQADGSGTQQRHQWGMREKNEPEATFDTLAYPSTNISTGARYDQLLEAKLGPGPNANGAYNQPIPVQNQSAEPWSNAYPIPVQYQSSAWYHNNSQPIDNLQPPNTGNIYPTSGRTISTDTSASNSPIPPQPLSSSYLIHGSVPGSDPSIPQIYPRQAAYFPYNHSGEAYSTRQDGPETARIRQQILPPSGPIYWSPYTQQSEMRAGPSRQSFDNNHWGAETQAQAQTQVNTAPLGPISAGQSNWNQHPPQVPHSSPIQSQATYPIYPAPYHPFPQHHTAAHSEQAPAAHPHYRPQTNWEIRSESANTNMNVSYSAPSRLNPMEHANPTPPTNISHSRTAVHPSPAGIDNGAPAIGQRKRRKAHSDEGRSGQLGAAPSGSIAPGMTQGVSEGSSSKPAQHFYNSDQQGPGDTDVRARTVSESRIEAISTLRERFGEGDEEAERKVVIACYHCRAKKLKCDGARPRCHHCSRRGEEGCSYDSQLRRRGPGKKTKGKVQAGREGGGGGEDVKQERIRGSRNEVGIGVNLKKEEAWMA